MPDDAWQYELVELTEPPGRGACLAIVIPDDELALQFTEDAASELEIPDVDGWLRFRLAVKPAARRKLRAGLEKILQLSS